MKHDLEMTFGEHLDELRKHLVRALLGLLVTTILCGIFYDQLLIALMRPYEIATHGMAETPRLILGNPLTGYVTTILLCIIVGVIVASPWVLYQIWSFIAVGLHAHERKFVNRYGPFSFVLFLAGGSLFYFLMLPMALKALMSPTMDIMVNGRTLIDPSFILKDYFNFVAVMTLVFGIVFQTPLIVMFLARTNIIPLRTLASQQRLVILIMTVVAALLTPTVDPISMAAMAVPLILLYELGLGLAWLSERAGRKRRAEEEAAEKAEEEAERAKEEAARIEREAARAREVTAEQIDTPSPGSSDEQPDTPSPGSSDEQTDTPSPGSSDEQTDTPSPGSSDDPYAPSD